MIYRYVIYHIPGIKVGATKDFATRSMQNRMTHGQDIAIEILQSFTTTDRVQGDVLASQLEAEYAKHYGYKLLNSYLNTMEAYRSLARSVRHHPRNPCNSQTHMARMTVNGQAALNEQVGCPYCPAVGQYRIMQRWHFFRCPARPKDE